MTAADRALASSRPLGVAAELGAQGLDPETVYSKRVILTGELEALKSRNGQWCFLNSLRLLSRVVGVLDVAVPEGLPQLQQEVDDLSATLWSPGRVHTVAAAQLSFDGATAVLNVGSQVRADLPWTSISASGWVARCTSGGRPLAPEFEQDNPITCLMSASFGVTEVFKRVYGVPADRAALVEDVAFSLFELSIAFADCGPPVPSSIALPKTLLLGAGAIGNGLALLLSQLPLTGELLVMDKQNFGTENHGTCTLLDSDGWLNQAKAEMLAAWLNERSILDVHGERTKIEDADARLTKGVDLVINGLDAVDARRAVQRLWPSLLVDGAINSLGAAVVTHSVQHRKFACLRCAFAEPDRDHIAVQTHATGLHAESLKGDQNRAITDEDISAAEEWARDGLREQQRLGKSICSTVGERTSATLGIKTVDGFRPSVPFVATAAAALVVAQVLRNLLWPELKFVHEFQFSSLFVGADTGLKVGRLAFPTCECTRNSAVIDGLIATRKASPSPGGR